MLFRPVVYSVVSFLTMSRNWAGETTMGFAGLSDFVVDVIESHGGIAIKRASRLAEQLVLQ